uniref:Adducin 1 (alpha) n=1 Tax=Eptatretus burgeri TaxID=7764 RepID=A0A8C4Q9P8_EPTBU
MLFHPPQLIGGLMGVVPSIHCSRQCGNTYVHPSRHLPCVCYVTMNGASEPETVVDGPGVEPDTERFGPQSEYLRERNMAADLRQDFNMMEQRKRVSVILQSPAFREELESLIDEQMQKGRDASGLLALQQIADYMLMSPAQHLISPGGITGLNMGLGVVVPVNDLRGSDSSAYTKGEKILRCKLASLYRVVDLFGWSELIYNHISVRVSKEQEQFLLIPFGLLFSEVTASSLVKINLQGDLLDKGSTNLGVNKAGYLLHTAIHSFRPDISCIIHVHTHAGAAVSAMKCGLLPISQESVMIGEIAHHDYEGVLVDEEEKTRLQKSLGPSAMVMILRNHGLVALGRSIEEAFLKIYQLVYACEIQVRTLASAGGVENVQLLDKEKLFSRTVGVNVAMNSQNTYGVGEQEFESLMRMMDNMGYRTGYPYRNPIVRDRVRARGEVEVPPSATGFILDDEPGPRSPLRHLAVARQQRERARWLHSPNAYMRVDAGESDGGTKTKWMKADEVPKAASKVDDANQFVPLNTDPREVLQARNKIRENFLQDTKSAGPQSQVLTGAVIERPQGQGEVLAASKAIIVKEFQTDVKLTAPPNPFRTLSEREMEEYYRDVERKRNPEAELVDGVDSQLEEDEKNQDEPDVPTPPATPPCQPEDDPPANPDLVSSLDQPSPNEQDATQSLVTTIPSPPASLESNEGPESPADVTAEVDTSKRQSRVSEGAEDPAGHSDGSPAKTSPSKKKKKFRTPSFLSKKNKKKSEKAEV